MSGRAEPFHEKPTCFTSEEIRVHCALPTSDPILTWKKTRMDWTRQDTTGRGNPPSWYVHGVYPIGCFSAWHWVETWFKPCGRTMRVLHRAPNWHPQSSQRVFRSILPTATVNQHPPVHHEGWMVSVQETVFCWVPVP
jgi:hypothetical protein